MSSVFATEALKITVAQICQNIGWHAVQSSPLDILVDVLQRFVSEISKAVHNYSVQYNRTEVNLDDLGLAFQDFSILLNEIQEYANNVDSVPFAYKIVDFPIQRTPNLQIPKSDSREVLMRPEHIPSYLPPLHPDLDEESLYPQPSNIDGLKKNGDVGVNGCDSTSSPLSSPRHGIKRSDWSTDSFNKRSRYYIEEEGRPMREVTSVFMTPTGFVSPVHEGKSAEASLPCLVDSPPPTPDPPPQTTAPSKKDSKVKDVKRDKSSKPKKDKEFSKKDSKKLKSSKKEKENKDSSNKHEKLSSLSASSKKEHGSSHKSSKSDKVKPEDSLRLKSKDKIKLKSRKDEAHKMKENFKLGKMKAKLKHSAASSSSSHVKPMKLSSSKKLKAARLAKSIKHFKGERTKIVEPPPPPSPPPALVVPTFPKEVCEPKISVVEPVIEKEMRNDFLEDDEDMDFREESPEPRLVIDDSLETQARQEKESRLEVIDECIEAVIRRGEEDAETENKAMDDTINSVVRGPVPMMRRLDAKDVYDFTDASDSSSLSSCDIPPHSPVQPAAKKDKKSSDNKKSSDSPKRSKKEKKKKAAKEAKAKSASPYSPPLIKNQKSNFILKVDDRTPSPILKDDLLSSDGSTPSSSPRSNSFFDHSPTPPQSSAHQSPLLSNIPSRPPPFVPGSSYANSPFTSVRPLGHIQTNPHFPTPPLFVNPGKSENGSSFQNLQPLNLAKSGPSPVKSSPEKSFELNSPSLSSPKDSSDLIKKAANILEKPKVKDRKKDKLKKKGHKELDKVKDKKEKEKEEVKEKEVKKPKEKPKGKSEKNTKIDKRKSKPEKKKKDKEEKIKEDSTVPKMTLKLASGPGSTKIFVKPNTKNSASLSSSPSPTHDMEDDIPSLPPRVPTPSPPREPTPPPRPRTPTPPPPSPPPVVKPVKELSPPPVVPPPVMKSTPSRGRGRGRKSASAANPPARTVITETLGTIVDESGNKIWICPACSKPDDGSPMIGCDECDDWYHWVCVNIVVPPKEEDNWYCERCIKKRKIKPKDKRRGKKHKKEK